MTPTQIQNLQKTIEENTKAVADLAQQLAIHNIKQEHFENLVMKHENSLFGQDDRKGLLQKFDIIEEKVFSFSGGLSKASWIISGVILSAIAIWIWQTFIAGLIP